MPALLVIAFLVVPLVELAVLLRVQREIGLPETLGLLIAMSLLGAFLLRREGARAWRAFTGALGTGRVPAREVADGALVMLGGALLLTPGFVTDVLGLVLILPPTRAVARRFLTGFVARRLVGGVIGPTGRATVFRGRWPGSAGQWPGQAPPPRHSPGQPPGSGRGGPTAPRDPGGSGRVIEGELGDPPSGPPSPGSSPPSGPPGPPSGPPPATR